MRRKFRSIYWTWVYLLYSYIHVSEKNMYVFVNMSLQKYYNLLEILGWPKSSFICEMLWKNPNEFFGWQNITEQRPHHFSALGTGFMEDNFSMDWEVGGWFCKIQAHYIYCALYFYFVAVSWYSPWRRKWQPTPVFFPGKSHGWRRLAGYSPRGLKESDTAEQLHLTHDFLPWLMGASSCSYESQCHLLSGRRCSSDSNATVGSTVNSCLFQAYSTVIQLCILGLFFFRIKC